MPYKRCRKNMSSTHAEVKAENAYISSQNIAIKKKVNDNTSKFESKVPKKKRKKSLKNDKGKYNMHKMKHKAFLSNIVENKNNLLNEDMSYIHPDRETNIDNSYEENWTHELETHITPSKSERDRNINSASFKVDTIYHTGNDSANNILSTLEDSYTESNEEVEDIILENTTSEFPEIDGGKSLHMNCYDMKDGKILVIKGRTRVYVHGSFMLSLLYGNLQILGHILTPSSNAVEVYSLRGFSYLYVQNIHEGQLCISENILKSKLRKIGVSKSDILNILSELEFNNSILICTSLNNFKLPYIEKHLSQKLLPSSEDNFPMVVKDDISNLNTMAYNSQWDDIIMTIDSTSEVMICGGKGVGKSTLLRYIINNILVKYNEILVIDLDPGQSEFTIPGCISAVIVRKPILGPNFTHLHKPERCIFMQNIDVTLEPDIYVKSVRELLKQCKDLTGIPTLINYMGYSHGYGIDIVSSIITYVSPTMVLQIESAQQSKNFIYKLTPDKVMQHLDMFGGASITNLSYETVIVDSMTDGLTSWLAQGRTIREMCILSYFSDIVDSSLTLTSKDVPLYKIALKDITLISNNSINCNNKLAVFNANLVGLCKATNTENIYSCHGWGIVRGIDEEVLVLITPVSEDILEVVTHLVVGSVTLPPSMFMYEDTNVGLIPYVSLGCTSSFNYVPKRSYLPRKK